MNHLQKHITLKHLLINGEKKIGIQFYPDKVIQALIKELPFPKWSKQFQMAYIVNNNINFKLILEKFKDVAWVNCNYFLGKKSNISNTEKTDLSWYYKRLEQNIEMRCPQNYIDKLVLKNYSTNTAKAYIDAFEMFMHFYKYLDLISITDSEIRNYLSFLISQGKSDSSINLAINSIKFYYEVVLQMPNRFYNIERPRKKEILPVVLSIEEISRLIDNTRNLKHHCIISLIYSSGLRRCELLNLKITDIDSEKMAIRVRQGKGNKDRYTLLSEKLLLKLRDYYKQYKPKEYLFEGQKGGKYSAESVLKIVKSAGRRIRLNKKVTPHILRHSFATHLLENGTDIRVIQKLLGHNSIKTTQRYTHIATNQFVKIKNPLDQL